MTNHERALAALCLGRLWDFEGGFSNDPLDRGGATKFGISLRFLRDRGIDINGDGAITEADILALDKPAAEELYLKHFWFPWLALLPVRLATWVFDFGVTSGPVTAAKALQEALLVEGLYQGAIDGQVGPKTLSAIQELAKRAGPLQDRVLVEDLELTFCRGRAVYYAAIVRRDPSQLRFLVGWIQRALS